MGYRLGVDLGTTYTAAALNVDGRVEMLSLGNRATQIASVVYVKEDGTELIGEPAEYRGAADPTRLAREFKRRIGGVVPIIIGGSPYSPQALLAKLLSWSVEVAARQQGEPPEHVCVTFPANWGPFKQEILEQVLKLAGQRGASTCTEPEAAAIAYASRDRVPDGAKLAVYDLGGGTFDAAVLVRDGVGFRLIGTPDGVEHLGGIDFDAAVIQHTLDELGPAAQQLDDSDPATLLGLNRLRRDCVAAKEALSSDDDTVIPVALPGISTFVPLSRVQFEEMVRPAIGETVSAMERSLASAGVTPADLHAIVMVGGSSRIPLVGRLLTEAFGRPLAMDNHPKHDVALGAAIRAQVVGAPSAGAIPGPVAFGPVAASGAHGSGAATGRPVGAPPSPGGQPSPGGWPNVAAPAAGAAAPARSGMQPNGGGRSGAGQPAAGASVPGGGAGYAPPGQPSWASSDGWNGAPSNEQAPAGAGWPGPGTGYPSGSGPAQPGGYAGEPRQPEAGWSGAQSAAAYQPGLQQGPHQQLPQQPGLQQPGSQQPGSQQPGSQQPGPRQPGPRRPEAPRPGGPPPGSPDWNPRPAASGGRRWVLIGAIGAVVALAIAIGIVVLPRVTGPGPTPTTAPTPTAASTATVAGPTLPASAQPLPDDVIIWPQLRNGGWDITTITSVGVAGEPLIASPEEDTVPVISPDRRTVLYLHATSPGIREVRVMGADGSGDRPLFDPVPAGCGNVTRPAFGDRPEPQLVLPCIDPATGDVTLKLVKLDGTVVRDLDKGWLSDPSLSPDGTSVVYWQDNATRGEGGAIYRAPVDGSAPPKPITAGGADRDNDADVSPTGDLVVITRAGRGIWTVGLGGTPGPTQLTREASDMDPCWSPDGRQIVFKRRDQMWVMNADGSNARRISEIGVIGTAPAWGPR